MSAFSSPAERRSPVYLEHIRGFQVEGDPDDSLLTVKEIEAYAADADPVVLRAALKGWHDEVSELSGGYLLNNLVIPNLPVGFYGDKTAEPTVLSAQLHVRPPELFPDDLEYYRKNNNSVALSIVPTIGELAYVSCIRDNSLGRDMVDWFSASPSSCSFSLFGGLLETYIEYKPNIEEKLQSRTKLQSES